MIAKSHTIKKGESLASLAKDNCTTVEQIRSMNKNISLKDIMPGTRIRIQNNCKETKKEDQAPVQSKKEAVERAVQSMAKGGKMSKAKRAKINAKRDYKKEYQRDQKSKSGYRAKLNREARKRGIYGKRRKKRLDLSHTRGGKMVLESTTKNRARNGKNRKSTLKS